MTPRTLLGPLVLLLLVPSAHSAGADVASDTPALSESVSVGLVRWPILVEASKGGDPAEACAALAPSDLVVEEDGMPMEVLHVERQRLPTTHALVVDVSGSMRGRMEWARNAARAYLEGLPAGEQAMLVAFSEDPVVVVPPTTNRERLQRAIDELEPIHNTALWGALLYTMRLVSAFPERPVLVLITDGEDTTSLLTHDAELVLAHARSMRDLAIYPVTLKLPTRPSLGSGELPRYRLAQLARETGGRHIDARDESSLESAFREVRRRVDAEWWIAYVPPRFGEGTRDHPDEGFRDRKVSVRSKRRAPCRAHSAGPSTRRSSRAKARGIELATAPLPEGSESLAAAFTLRARPGWGLDKAALVLVPREPRAPLVLEVPAIVEARGLLYREDRAGRSPRTRVVEASTYGVVEARLSRLPFEGLRAHVDSPLAVFLALRELGGVPNEGGPLSPLVLEGHTLLEFREGLGLALFRSSPDIAEWAAPRLARDAFAVLKQERAFVEGDDLTEAELLEALTLRAGDPEALALSRRCAAWLGDVAARDLAAELDLRSARAHLEALELGSASPPAPEAAWRDLVRWLSPATRLRVVAPLVPAWSAESEALGFYRFVLPTPSRYGGPADMYPPLMVGRTLLDFARLHDAGPRSGQRLRRLVYREEEESRRDARSLPRSLGGKGGEGAVFTVALELEGEGAGRLAARIRFEKDTKGELRARPECLSIEGAPDIATRLAAEGPLCR